MKIYTYELILSVFSKNGILFSYWKTYNIFELENVDYSTYSEIWHSSLLAFKNSCTQTVKDSFEYFFS